MKERSDIDWNTLLQTPLDRRRFLELLGAGTALVLLEGGCDLALGPRRNELPFDPSSEFIAEIQKSVAPIRRILTPAMREFDIKLHQGRNGIAHGDSLSHNEIHILLPDTSADSLQLGREVAVHEATHIFNFSNGNFPWKYLKDEMIKRAGKNKYSKNEFNILTESTYSDNPLWDGMGHPRKNYNEQLASTVSIMRYHHQQFMERINLLNPTDKRFMATTGLVAMDTLVKFAAVPTDYNDLGFDPQLITYLRQEGQPAV